jgi:small subunit ribosomal protein S9
MPVQYLENFEWLELIGFHNPSVSYPSSVVPICSLGNDYYAVYLNDDGTYTVIQLTKEDLFDNNTSTVILDKDCSIVRNFKPSCDRLYAINESDHFLYKHIDKKAFFYNLLRDQSFLNKYPNAALGISKMLGNQLLVEASIYNDIRIQENIDSVDIQWYEHNFKQFDQWRKTRVASALVDFAKSTAKHQLMMHWDAWATGRRKSACARVYLRKSESEKITINNLDINDYFKTESCRLKVLQPIKSISLSDNFLIKVSVKGGGFSGQAEAIRHGITNAISLFDIDTRFDLRATGLVTRDSRIKERKKVGRKKARKRPQFSKR